MKIPGFLKRILLASEENHKSSLKVLEALGRIQLAQKEELASDDLHENEFSAFSQWGEDGIIQFLLRKISVPSKTFVEFGVEDYREANTRFLLVNDNWSGLIIDGSAENIAAIQKDDISWRHDLTAIHAFIDRENINSLIARGGFGPDLGILSIDIDGNDYWVWEAISGVQPAIVIVEYNHRFGPTRAVTTPYAKDFMRSNAHHSNIYYGASLEALRKLGERKGYVLVGCNSAGNNAFFVRKDLKPESMKALTSQEAFVAGKFREARRADGTLAFLSAAEEEKILTVLPLTEV